ncbi:MAG: thioredoxin family protein [bacterium]|nr:thioredoxin family protein [bacterium]
MALLESSTTQLGSSMPSFTLNDANGRAFSRDELCGEKGLLVIFSCNHCPYAVAVWPRLVELANYGKQLGIHSVAINPNIHPDYPEDAADKMPAFAAKMGISFPYLVDDTQAVSKSYDAQCTPDMYLLDYNGELVYRGRIDDNWQDETRVTRQDLKSAMQALSVGKAPIIPQYPSMGCSIKWH